MSGILNLQKNDILDLTKKDPSLDRIILGAGWDVAKKGFFSFGQKDFDLDLIAIALNQNNKLISKKNLVYYANMGIDGIQLHGDNRTGQGDGDDEKISICLSNLDSSVSKIVFAINIYDSEKRNQTFEQVKNAYIRLLDENKGNKEICRFNLSELGDDKTALIFAELYKVNGTWNFKAVGEGLKSNIQGIVNKFI